MTPSLPLKGLLFALAVMLAACGGGDPATIAEERGGALKAPSRAVVAPEDEAQQSPEDEAQHSLSQAMGQEATETDLQETADLVCAAAGGDEFAIIAYQITYGFMIQEHADKAVEDLIAWGCPEHNGVVIQPAE
jgi:hypothetical protein